MTLQQAKTKIGCEVTYTPFPGCSKSQLEYGIITSVNEKYVFVRYGKDIHSKATRPEDLK